MSEEFQEVAATREGAHDAIGRAYAHAKRLLEGGDKVMVIVRSGHIPLSERQRKFLHGVVLPQVSEQVRMPDGTRYTAEAWKEYFRNMFIPPKWEVLRLPGQKKAVPRRIFVSTESLSERAYSRFIDQCIDYATLEWNVQFRFVADEREQARYRPPNRKQTGDPTCPATNRDS